MSQSTRILILLLVVVGLGGGAYWYFVLNAEDEFPVDDFGTPGMEAGGFDDGTGGFDDGMGEGAGPGADDPAGGIDAGADAGAEGGGDGAASGLEGLAGADLAAASPQLAQGSATGNTAAAVEVAGVAVTAGEQQNLALEVQVMTLPATVQGDGDDAQQRYARSVTAASMRVKFDGSGSSEWQGASQQVRRALLESWLGLLGERFPQSARAVTVVDAQDTLLATADQARNQQRARFGFPS